MDILLISRPILAKLRQKDIYKLLDQFFVFNAGFFSD